MSKYTFPAIRKNLECGFDPNNVASGREPCQMGWYEFISDLIKVKTKDIASDISILDVGCGMCDGIKRMRQRLGKNYNVFGQEIDDRLQHLDESIIIKNINEIADKSFDFVTCFDVIEHVIDDWEFFTNLKRICKSALFITTPNFTRSKAQNHCHCREYTIPQFVNYFSPDELWVASPDGFIHRNLILKKDVNLNYVDLTRDGITYDCNLQEDISFIHSTVDGNEWPHYLGIFKC